MAHKLRATERELRDGSLHGMRSLQTKRGFHEPERSLRGPRSNASEYDSNVSDSETNSNSEGSSGKTPSEYSLPTPEDEHFQPEIDQFYFGMDVESATFPIPVASAAKSKRLSEEGTLTRRPLSVSRPQMLASFTTQQDFNFDRLSTLIDATRMQHLDLVSEEDEREDEDEDEGEESASDLDLEEDDLYSPIEVARSVAIATLRARPAVVSVSSPRTPTFPKSVHEDLARISSSSRSSRRSSGGSSHANNTSQSLPSEKRSGVASHDPFYWSEADEIETRPTVLDHKPAYPRRVSSSSSSSNSSSRSSRMSSLKNFMRSTSTQLIDIKEETASSKPSRPATAKHSPQDFGAFIATSAVPRKALNTTPVSVEPALLTDQRKRSFSSLRSRSGSIGESLKSNLTSSKTSSASTPPLPALPHLVIPARSTSKRHSREVRTAPAAPPIAPRDPRRTVGNYTAFPRTDSISYRSAPSGGTRMLQAV